ncbi:unnamed protein product [Phytophthora fragariaefolia]|uniref:Unnamed protein product n=1 Tax=Phytophthora fragariaefolia TaxID=1490495 RepID=A0A9W6Y2F8_9STRA|nr:unnamed protein product [Phytophthora fragariaefolia]
MHLKTTRPDAIQHQASQQQASLQPDVHQQSSLAFPFNAAATQRRKTSTARSVLHLGCAISPGKAKTEGYPLDSDALALVVAVRCSAVNVDYKSGAYQEALNAAELLSATPSNSLPAALGTLAEATRCCYASVRRYSSVGLSPSNSIACATVNWSQEYHSDHHASRIGARRWRSLRSQIEMTAVLKLNWRAVQSIRKGRSTYSLHLVPNSTESRAFRTSTSSANKTLRVTKIVAPFVNRTKGPPRRESYRQGRSKVERADNEGFQLLRSCATDIIEYAVDSGPQRVTRYAGSTNAGQASFDITWSGR